MKAYKFSQICEKICSKSPILLSGYTCSCYLRNIDDLNSIPENSNVLFVGCGAIPSMPILIADLRKCRVTSMDIDEGMIAIASSILNKWYNKLPIDLIYMDGKDADVAKYDIVMCASTIPKTDKCNIKAKCEEAGVRYLIRATENLWED